MKHSKEPLVHLKRFPRYLQGIERVELAITQALVLFLADVQLVA